MVRIRLRRQGLKRQPSYRVVVTDQRKARNGSYLENIGHYNPRTRPATEIIAEDRALYWLSVGAQPSDAVRRLLEHTGTWERFQRLRAGESLEEPRPRSGSKPPRIAQPTDQLSGAGRWRKQDQSSGSGSYGGGRPELSDAIDMPTKEEELVKYIAENLVNAPDEVSIRRRETNRSVVLELSVASGDMGRVIGRNGRVANSIRALLRAIDHERGRDRRRRVIQEIE